MEQVKLLIFRLCLIHSKKKEKGGRQGGSEGLKKKGIRMTSKQEVKFEKNKMKLKSVSEM